MIDNDRKGVKSLIWSSIFLIRFIILTNNCGADREWVGHSDSWILIYYILASYEHLQKHKILEIPSLIIFICIYNTTSIN